MAILIRRGIIPPVSTNGTGVNFDGSTYTSNNSPTMPANGSQFVTSVWLKPANSGATRNIVRIAKSAGGPILATYLNGSDQFSILAFDNTFTTLLDIHSTATFSSSAWKHVVCSVDLGVSVQMYVSGSNDSPTITTNISGTCQWNSSKAACGVDVESPGTNPYSGDMDQVQLWLDTTIDLSVGSNLQKFYNAGSNPVDPSIPAATLGQQLFLFNGSLANWPTNSGGTAGTFTTTGTFTPSSAGPP